MQPVIPSTFDGDLPNRRRSVSQISDEEMSRRAEESVLQRIASTDLGLPAMPLVATKCLEILSRNDFSLGALAGLIETDPLVAASVVRVANSAANATLEPAKSVLQAITRIGSDELRSFIFEISARPVFESHDRTISALGRAMWSHSVAVALLARAIVRRTKGKHPEAAYLAGLLHDIGKPVMATMLLDAERRLLNVRTRNWLFPATWLGLIARTHRKVGLSLSKSWHLPVLVVQTVAVADSYDSTAPASPANAVCLANALAKAAGLYAGDVDKAAVEALISSGRKLFALSDADIEGLTKGLKERVNERLGGG